MKARGGKEGGAQFSHSVLGSVRFCLQIRMCLFLFCISEHGQIKEEIRDSVIIPLLDIEGSRELLAWKTFAGRATWS